MFKKIKKVWSYYRRHGLKLLLLRLFFPYQVKEPDYDKWREKHAVGEDELKRQSKYEFDRKVLISIAVPTYQTPEKFLRKMIESVIDQTCSDWELCIADGSENPDVCHIIQEYVKRDERIKVKHLAENRGIAENTNEALKMCSGEYIGLLDHDDVLAPNALFEVRRAIEENLSPEIIYTDEDKISEDGKEVYDPNFKPGFNREMLCSNNYICHFFVVKNTILQKVQGLRTEYDGAQDYDFILRCTERSDSIVHIAEPLYHWRMHTSSTASNPESKLYAFEAGKKAIEDHLKRRGERGVVEYTEHLGFYHITYGLKTFDRITVIVVKGNDNRSGARVGKCIASIKKTCGYLNYHIIVADRLTEINVSDIEGKFILLVNSSIKMISRGWMKAMLGNCQRDIVGAVGIKLYNRNETIRHAGIIQGRQKYAFEGLPRVRYGYFHRDSIMQYVSGVTTDFMMIPADIFTHLWNKFPECFLDEWMLCRRIRAEGRYIVYDPDIEAYSLIKNY